ncbi:MAG: hypothetical protein AAFV29_21765, partial [Myxococcota bacterium]
AQCLEDAALVDGIPEALRDFATEPFDAMPRSTFCLWNTGDGWCRSKSLTLQGRDPDGSLTLLKLLAGEPADYLSFAKRQFRATLPHAEVESVYRREPLRPASILSLRPDAQPRMLREDLADIGYPLELYAPPAVAGSAEASP